MNFTTSLNTAQLHEVELDSESGALGIFTGDSSYTLLDAEETHNLLDFLQRHRDAIAQGYAELLAERAHVRLYWPYECPQG